MYNPSKPYKYEILRLIESTWKTPYVRVERGLYPIIYKKFSYPEIQHTDGIGTKGVSHWEKRTFKNAVQDALAMNLNDLAMVGAVPYALQNHIVLPQDDHRAIMQIVRTLARECFARSIAMTGGETSIHEGLGALDISITVSGFLRSKRSNRCKSGDILIGLKSSGVHSNGITRARQALGKEYGPEFVKPTLIYSDTVLALLDTHTVHGMMHITGGAFTKLKDILGSNDAIISQPSTLAPQKIFKDIYGKGVTSKEMYTTFNCGVGFVLSVPAPEAPGILSIIKNSAVIGKVRRGSGKVEIRSAFEDVVVAL